MANQKNQNAGENKLDQSTSGITGPGGSTSSQGRGKQTPGSTTGSDLGQSAVKPSSQAGQTGGGIGTGQNAGQSGTQTPAGGISSTSTMGSSTGGSTGSSAGSAGSMTTGSSSSTTSPNRGTVSGGSSGTGAGTATARSLYDQAKETAGQAYEVAAEKATTKLEEQKSTLSGGLASVAGSVRKVSENLRGPDVQDGISKFTAQYSDTAARKIEDVANYFEQKSVSEMYSDVETFARKNPAVFVGGAFALGLLAARFLKSGASSHRSNANTGSSNRSLRSGSGQGIQGIDAGTSELGGSLS